MELYILDKNLDLVCLIDSFTSLIWDVYYNKVGAGELYIAATTEALQNIKQGYYVQRSDNDRLMRVRKIELDTSAENGNYLIFSLESVEGILAQRIVWGTATCNGKLEPWLHDLVEDNLGVDAPADRIIKTPNGTTLVTTGTLEGFKRTGGDQTTFGNVADKIADICYREGWGFRLVLSSDGSHFVFEIYKGTDRSSEVFFSDEFGNLITTQYIDDQTKLGNTAVVAGEGEGAERARLPVGEATGANRHEVYVDARDLSHNITYGELTKAYPGGTVRTESGQGGEPDRYYYYMDPVNIPLITDSQEDILEELYPDGVVVTIDGARYYQLDRMYVAEVPSAAPDSDDTAVIIDALYYGYLADRGLTKLSEYGERVSFTGEIEPNENFKFGVDYFLGDIVSIESGYGISASARIVEVQEVFDANGHTVTPKYEYIEQEE